MLDWLINIDISVFRFINTGLANPVFDLIMPIITSEKIIVPIYVLALLVFAIKGDKKARMLIFALILTVIISDQFSSSYLKHLVGRIRPCSSLSDVRLLVGCGGGKSFPSSHAVNNFAAAMALAYHYRKYAKVFFSIAFAIAFSRIYVGVHFPGDVLAGILIGCAIGFLTGKYLFNLVDYLYNKIANAGSGK